MPENEWTFSHRREEYVSEAGIIGQRGKNATRMQWYHHMSAESIRRQLGESLWQEYFKFCVIRNPFDKLVSAFHFFEHRLEKGKVSKLPEDMTVDVSLTQEERFRYWISQGGFVYDRPTYTINNEICVDYFIRFENLEEGIRHVCKTLQIPYEPSRIPNFKSGIRPAKCPLRGYYDSKTIEIVASKYEFEIKTFKYSAPC